MLNEAMKNYLVLRRAAGFKYIEVEKQLRSYIKYAAQTELAERHLCAANAIEWAKLGRGPRSRYLRMRTISMFADHLRAEDMRHEAIPSDVIAVAHSKRYPPRIFSQEEIARILGLTDSLKPTNSIRPLLYRTLIGLLFVTGMRVSEALQLRFKDVQADGLLIHKTKFGKSRQLPLHTSTSTELEKYLHARRLLYSESDRLFLAPYRDHPLRVATVRRTFQMLCAHLEIEGAGGRHKPRLHDLRHSFAVAALVRCQADRDGVDKHMLALSTYMGHVSIKSTYWYLEQTPELLRNIANACEKQSLGVKS